MWREGDVKHIRETKSAHKNYGSTTSREKTTLKTAKMEG